MAIQFLNTVQVDTSVLYVDTANDKVGIGTTSPSEKLEVSGSNALSIKLSRNNTDATYVTTLTNNYSSTLGTELKSGTYNILTHGNSTGTALNFTNGAMTFDFRNSEYMRITDAGNVGIGTTSPGSGYAYDIKLDIVAPQLGGIPLRLVRDSSIVNYGAMIALAAKNSVSEIITYGAITGGIIDSTDGSEDGYVSIRTIKAGVEAEKVRVDENGNVGIGTVSPGVKLEVDTNSTFAGAAQFGNSTGNRLYILNDDGGNRIQLDAISSGGASNLIFSNGGSEAMRITSAGNVGIGTTSPGTILDVSYGANASNTAAINLNGANGAAAELVLRAGGDDNGTIYNRRAAIRYISNQISTTAAQWVNGVSMSQTTDDDKFYFNNSGNSTVLCLQQNGNVGIGTTSPDARLDVNGGLNSTHAIFSGQDGRGLKLSTENTLNNDDGVVYDAQTSTGKHLFKVSGAEKMRIDTSGNVGIGVTGPLDKLDVSNGNIRISQTGNVAAQLILNTYQSALGNATYKWFVEQTTSANSYSFQIGNGTTPYLHINSVLFGAAAGNVGIGNTSPNHKLDVTGDIYSSGQMLTKGAAMACFTVLGDLDTGLGNFNTLGRVSLVSNNKPSITVNDDKVAFDGYIATAVATTGSLNANQSQQALTSDTLAVLAVDPTGNIVRGSQEGTWTFTKAQLDALTTSTTSGTTLIAAPGANKAIIVEESNLMIKYSGTGTMSSNSFVIRQAHNGDATAEITRLPSGQINTIMSSAPANPSYGFYSRDLPLYNNDGRSFVTNKATFLSRINTNATPTNLVSISIKLKYRIFNATTF